VTDAKEFFNKLGVSTEDVDKVEDRQRLKGPTDRRICLCGHGTNKHQDPNISDVKRNRYIDGKVAERQYECRPNASVICPCKLPLPVIVVSDSRWFLRKTTGGGASHALIRGIRSLLDIDNATVEWLIEPTCFKCGDTSSGNILPVPLTKTGNLTHDGLSEGYDRLLCEECRKEV
jgi:hypothetical protein